MTELYRDGMCDDRKKVFRTHLGWFAVSLAATFMLGLLFGMYCSVIF